jgi:Sulfotransferase domain
VSSIDAIIYSYPKCGRTLVRRMLAELLVHDHALPVTPTLRTMYEIIPSTAGPSSRTTRMTMPVGVPRVSMSHCVPALPPDRPFVCLVREPHAVLISHFHHARFHYSHLAEPYGSADAPNFSRFLTSSEGMPALMRYLDWLSDVPAERAIRYETLCTRRLENLRQMCELLGWTPSEAGLQRAAAAGDFGRMSFEETSAPMPGHTVKPRDPDSRRMRVGRATAGCGEPLFGDEGVREVEARELERASHRARSMFRRLCPESAS